VYQLELKSTVEPVEPGAAVYVHRSVELFTYKLLLVTWFVAGTLVEWHGEVAERDLYVDERHHKVRHQDGVDDPIPAGDLSKQPYVPYPVKCHKESLGRTASVGLDVALEEQDV